MFTHYRLYVKCHKDGQGSGNKGFVMTTLGAQGRGSEGFVVTTLGAQGHGNEGFVLTTLGDQGRGSQDLYRGNIWHTWP